MGLFGLTKITTGPQRFPLTIVIIPRMSKNNYYYHWYSYDTLIYLADGAFAVGIVLSFFRLMYLCQITSYLGLLQLCLGEMIMVRYSGIILLFVFYLIGQNFGSQIYRQTHFSEDKILGIGQDFWQFCPPRYCLIKYLCLVLETFHKTFNFQYQLSIKWFFSRWFCSLRSFVWSSFCLSRSQWLFYFTLRLITKKSFKNTEWKMEIRPASIRPCQKISTGMSFELKKMICNLRVLTFLSAKGFIVKIIIIENQSNYRASKWKFLASFEPQIENGYKPLSVKWSNNLAPLSLDSKNT